MDLQTISILKSVVFFFMFLFPSYVGIPKAVRFWEEWKNTKKLIFLSHAVTFFVGSIFFYVTALLITILEVLGYHA
jgi:hypothetical protein